MKNDDINDPYDRYYYQTSCGAPYERTEGWLSFFRGIAGRIVEDINPKKVLDAGCAKGFLVEALRDMGVDSYGIDISEYAINEVRLDIKEFCSVGSILDPLDKVYDLIVTIEVMEHLTPDEGKRAIENLCHYTDDIIFTSTPNDYNEATHKNVQQPEYWAEIFARNGFIRDIDYDASYIAEHAMRFIRTRNTLPAIVREYERNNYRKTVENQKLRKLALESRNELSHLHSLIEQKDIQLRNEVSSLELLVSDRDSHLAILNEQLVQLRNEVSSLELLVSDRDSHLAILNEQILEKSMHVVQLSDELNAIKKSIVWQLTMKFHRIIEIMLPINTRRRHLYELGIKGGGILVNEGWSSFWMRVKEYRKSKKKVDNEYLQWIAENEPSEAVLKQQKNDAQTLQYLPRISIVMPVWNTDERWLRCAIESVLEQTYDNWELCIADGGSNKSHVREILQEYARRDDRIRITLLEENKGISGNSNEALALATGDFIALLDHDDELASFALYEVVKTLNENPDLDYLYSDEDKIDINNNRKDPFFKPDWSPELFLSCNYLCHFSVIRKKIVDSLNGFRSEFDGSQDYDLFLRVTEKCGENAIAHIPKILYHWRMIPGSAATSNESKPYAYVAAKKALKDAMTRRKVPIKGIEDGFWVGSYRIHYALENDAKVHIIIPTKDKVDVLKTCISSILKKTDYNNYEIIIVDNQSNESETQDYYNSIKNDSKVKVINFEEKFNFSAINNYAISMARGEYIVLLNNDTEIINGEWLTAMLEHAQRNDVGAVGAKLLFPDNLIQHCGIILGLGCDKVAGNPYYRYPEHHGYFGRINVASNYSAVTAACMMIRRAVFEEVGGFDENLAVAFNDVDLCLKIRQNGYLIVYTPYAQLYHHESLSRGYEDTPEKQARFIKEVQYIRKRWGMIIDEGDPYYNPNLSLNSERYDYKI